jgi:thioredoxin-related protein
MKKIIGLIIFLFLARPSFAQIDFMKGSLADAFQKAKSENKVLMVDVYTEWCKWCVELDNKVYSKKDVYEFANANQVNYRIDAEKGEGVDFAKTYKVKGFPTVLFLNGNREEIDRIFGYVPEKDFLEMMTDYNKGINTFDYLEKKLEKNPEDLDANLLIADKYMSLGDNDKAKGYLEKIIQTDPQNTLGKTVKAKFRLAELADKDHIIPEMESFISEYPNDDEVKDAYITIADAYYYDKKDPDDAQKYYREALSKFPDYDGLRSSYGQFLNARAAGIAYDTLSTAEDYAEGLKLTDEALPYVAGSVNEASSYFIQSKIYYYLEEYQKADGLIDKALKIFDRKLYRDLKEAIEKKLGIE